MNKKLLLTMMMTGLIASSVVSARPHAHDPEERFEHMLKRLELSEVQQKQAEPIIAIFKEAIVNDERASSFKALRSLNPGDEGYIEKATKMVDHVTEQKRQEMMAMVKAKQDIYKLLTDKQKETFMKMSQKRPDFPKGMKEHGNSE